MAWIHFKQRVYVGCGGQKFNMAIGQGDKDGEKPEMRLGIRW